MDNGGLSALRRSVQALLDCGMICEEEVEFLYAVIAEQAAVDACRPGLTPLPHSRGTGAAPAAVLSA